MRVCGPRDDRSITDESMRNLIKWKWKYPIYEQEKNRRVSSETQVPRDLLPRT